MTDTTKNITQFVVKEMNRIHVTTTYLIQLSDNPLERHNELRSMETFRKKFLYPIPEDLTRWYKVQTYQEWYKAQRQPYVNARHQLPLEFCTYPKRDVNEDCTVDLWTFYNRINFDYKKQTYIT